MPNDSHLARAPLRDRRADSRQRSSRRAFLGVSEPVVDTDVGRDAGEEGAGEGAGVEVDVGYDWETAFVGLGLDGVGRGREGRGKRERTEGGGGKGRGTYILEASVPWWATMTVWRVGSYPTYPVKEIR